MPKLWITPENLSEKESERNTQLVNQSKDNYFLGIMRQMIACYDANVFKVCSLHAQCLQLNTSPQKAKSVANFS